MAIQLSPSRSVGFRLLCQPCWSRCHPSLPCPEAQCRCGSAEKNFSRSTVGHVRIVGVLRNLCFPCLGCITLKSYNLSDLLLFSRHNLPESKYQHFHATYTFSSTIKVSLRSILRSLPATSSPSRLTLTVCGLHCLPNYTQLFPLYLLLRSTGHTKSK